ncbi:hypothetical protein GALMADRAFT_213538 [Galerina marginata CBS 339.88]|uniref:Uncharacterized protein n=1 Tax=Galerina marginata (strain CBS 339.88) TaxID=685588 RepID=A0A067SWN7_GALM3|nr:hypothetical protein GALMADRAFT_213538 [Galerina marginata CBS 339.88]
MSFRTLAICTLLALHIFIALGGPVDSRSSEEELVMTPGGLIPKTNIHAVPEGARVHHTKDQVQIIGADGTVLHTAPVFAGTPTKLNIAPTTRSSAPRSLQSGYIAYAFWENPATSIINSFTTSWTVPPTPTSLNGQLLYWFNGLVPNSFDAILQPVLQFGVSPAGGGNFYAVASWFVVGSSAFHGPLTTVQPGQQLTGFMILDADDPVNSTLTVYTWSSSFRGVSGPFDVTTTELLSFAYEALEIYTTPFATDLPAGHTAMTGINIGIPPVASLGWEVVSDFTDRVLMSVSSASSTNGAMQITYPQVPEWSAVVDLLQVLEEEFRKPSISHSRHEFEVFG